MPQKFTTVDEYAATFEGVPLERVEEMRALLKSYLPDSEERISYNIPAYFVNNKIVVYFAGYSQHIGMYPIHLTNDEKVKELIAPYAQGKSTARFSHSEPLPKDIIKKFVEARLAEVNSGSK